MQSQRATPKHEESRDPAKAEEGGKTDRAAEKNFCRLAGVCVFLAGSSMSCHSGHSDELSYDKSVDYSVEEKDED